MVYLDFADPEKLFEPFHDRYVMSLLVVGNIAFDTIARVKFLPGRNEATSIIEIKECFGGCAGNVAVIAKRLGIDSSLCSAVGEDFRGSGYEKRLRELGVDLEHLQYTEEDTARSFMFSDDRGNQQIYYYPGASSKLRYREMDFSRYKLVHFSAGEISVYGEMMRSAKVSGCLVSFDPGQEIFHRDVRREVIPNFENADYIFLNEHEYSYLEEKIGHRYLEDLLSGGTKAVIISMGERGSEVYTRDYHAKVPAIKVKAIRDPTGAGDAHRAGFITGILKGCDVVTSCRIGSIVSHYIIQEVGAQENVPTWEDVMKTYRAVFGDMDRNHPV